MWFIVINRLYGLYMTNQPSGKGDLKRMISHTRLYRLTLIRSDKWGNLRSTTYFYIIWNGFDNFIGDYSQIVSVLEEFSFIHKCRYFGNYLRSNITLLE